MTVCPKCGATIQFEGTCYNCVRIEREQKRYGNRRPLKGYGHLPLRKKSKPAPPATSPKRGPSQPKPEITKQPEPLPQIPEPVLKQPSKPEQEVKKVEPKRKPPKKYTTKPAVTLDQHRIAFNKYLKDLYQRPRYISQVLEDGKLTSKKINKIQNNHLQNFIDALVLELLTFWKKGLRWQEYEVLKARYGFGDGRPSSDRYLMKQFDFTQKQIDKYRQQGIKRLRYASNIEKWEKLVIKTARGVLKKEQK